MYGHHVCLLPLEARSGHQIPWKEVVVSCCHEGAENQTLVLCKISPPSDISKRSLSKVHSAHYKMELFSKPLVLYNWPEDGHNMRKVLEITVLVKGWLAQDVVVDGQKPGEKL